MPISEQFDGNAPDCISLRHELSLRNLHFASAYGYLYERTDGEVPSIIFGRDEDGWHGNFHHDAYQSICTNDQWAKRLEKVHTAYKRVRVRSNWQWKELDCSNSSDALFMNIFCYPEVVAGIGVRAILGGAANSVPEFGFRPRTPLHNGRSENTEVDMKLGELLIEAKLTEPDFQWANAGLISRYRDLELIFDPTELPTRKGKQSGYQLIRGALAAYATESSFCVLCDARRPDLVKAWFRILRAVRLSELRTRLKLLTWQELDAVLPAELQEFLAAKYGIVPAV